MACDKWQRDRARLNHNCLQNGILIGLNHAIGIASGKVRSRMILKKLREDIAGWYEHAQEIFLLIERFETEMSPRVAFERAPLCRCSDETKKWLIPLIHELWLQRENLKQRIEMAKETHTAADQSYTLVAEALNDLPESLTIADLKPVVKLLQAFISSCEDLNKAISVFPYEIRYI